MSETLIAVKNLVKEYGNGVRALDQIDLEIGRGDIFGIIGMSGAGKSTLVRCLNNLEKPTEGTVEIQGRDLSKMKGRTSQRETENIHDLPAFQSSDAEKCIGQYLFSIGDCRCEKETGKRESQRTSGDRRIIR